MLVRAFTAGDRSAVGPILAAAFAAGDTFALPADLSPDAAMALWEAREGTVYVADNWGQVLGTYRLGPRGGGRGAHLCRCDFVTAPEGQGRGVGSDLLAHALGEAKRQRFRGIVLDGIVAVNERALRLSERAGFHEVGRIPGGFLHPLHGYVDMLTLYKPLVKDA